MKHLHPRLIARNDRESSFHHCGGPMKLVQACLSARKDLESSFYHSGGPARSCKALYVPQKAVLTAEEVM